MTEHDYNVCPDTTDGVHVPRPAEMSDREMPPGYFTVECAACGQTTGYPVPDPDELDWG